MGGLKTLDLVNIAYSVKNLPANDMWRASQQYIPTLSAASRKAISLLVALRYCREQKCLYRTSAPENVLQTNQPMSTPKPEQLRILRQSKAKLSLQMTAYVESTLIETVQYEYWR
jgi:hypothetical protein